MFIYLKFYFSQCGNFHLLIFWSWLKMLWFVKVLDWVASFSPTVAKLPLNKAHEQDL